MDMKGNEKIIALLNDFLADELTAISQYMVHSEMCANWGYKKLHEATEKRAIDEMKHAEKLIGRILFLEGQPVVSQLNKINIGATVEGQLKNDLEAEAGAIEPTMMAFAYAWSLATTAPANSSMPICTMRRNTSIGWKPSLTRSTRWACRIIFSPNSRNKYFHSIVSLNLRANLPKWGV
jgi:bacterioferritin